MAESIKASFPPVFYLNTINGRNGIVIKGTSGLSVSKAGDINADGIADILIGNYGVHSNAGQSYIVFGCRFIESLNINDLNGRNGFALTGINWNDSSGRSVSTAGDINADGIDDVIIGAYGANNSTGQSYVVFGRKYNFPESINFRYLNGINGFTINGISQQDRSGMSVSKAGDINGDGIDDLIIGAPGVNNYTGQSYVVFGSPEGFPAAFNLTSLNGSNGFIINGIRQGDWSGYPTSDAGDMNGDGIDDLIIGAYPANSFTGQSYVVFGSRGGFPAVLNLASLNGVNGFTINGINQYDYSGNSVSGAGDINGDGIDDVIISAMIANNSTGQSYVVFGSQEGFPAAFSLRDLNGINGFTINGINQGDQSGWSVSEAGDINADGISDIIISTPLANSDSGQSYVVFGSREGFPAVLNLASLDGMNGFAINGISQNDQSGYSVNAAGDIDADGIDDLLIGAFATESYIIFGRRELVEELQQDIIIE